MTPLDKIIRHKIHTDGPMNMEEFIALALGHPEHGYYMTRDPLGAAGDFTTAPEISQLFGEMIGAWVAQAWMKLGSPSPFLLIEAGPGRGTLMADVLRATKNVRDLHQAVNVVLIETSPTLTRIQKDRLKDYKVIWCDSLDHPDILSASLPVIFIANEFLDALPIRQFQFNNAQWHERKIGIEGNDLKIITKRCHSGDIADCGAKVVEEGDVFELSPARASFVSELSHLLVKNNGAALLIDYGHEKTGCGDTLQAVHRHRYCSFLENIGEVDITSHVDFESLAKAAAAAGVSVSCLVEQGLFLESAGIFRRLEILKNRATGQQAENLQSGCSRLTSPDQMGRLFKAMALYQDKNH